MRLDVEIIRTSAQTIPPGVVRLRKYGDPIMIKLMGLDTKSMGTSNFQNIALWAIGGGFGAVTKFQVLNVAAMKFLVGIQPKDTATLSEKMTFLVGVSPGRPYWTDLKWDTYAFNYFRFGTILFGGQLCMVETDINGNKKEYVFQGKYQSAAISEPITFYKLVGMRWADRLKYSHDTHPWFIQKGTWASYPENNYHDTWHNGIVYHPVWSPLDFPHNYGNISKGEDSHSLYIAKAFTEAI